MKVISSRSFFILTIIFYLSCTEAAKKEIPSKSHQIATSKSSAQNPPTDFDPYFEETYTTATSNGPTSITRNILQDRKGNIWLATWEGIIRYDGKTFLNFTNQEKLRRYHVFSVLEDTKGHLWFGTIGAGVYHYDGKAFTNFTAKEGLIDDKVTCLYEDSKGIIWIGTVGGISKYDGHTFQNITTKEGLSTNDVNSIIEDKTGKYWIGTRGQPCIYDGTTFSIIKNPKGAPFINIRSIIEDQYGNIWMGGNGGLWCYNHQEWTNFATSFVGYIYEDTKGNIWTSSESADNKYEWVLSRYDKKPLTNTMITATTIKQEENMFFGIVEDKEGGIWWGSLRGACRFDGESFDCF